MKLDTTLYFITDSTNYERDEFLRRVALEGNGLDDFDEIEEIEGIPNDLEVINNELVNNTGTEGHQ